MDPKGKQNCVTDTSFTLIIDNQKHICVHDCPPIVQKKVIKILYTIVYKL